MISMRSLFTEDYSSSSSSSDYSSDSEASWEDDSILVEDDKSHMKAVKAQLNPRANRMDDPKFNPSIKVKHNTILPVILLSHDNPSHH